MSKKPKERYLPFRVSSPEFEKFLDKLEERIFSSPRLLFSSPVQFSSFRTDNQIVSSLRRLANGTRGLIKCKRMAGSECPSMHLSVVSAAAVRRQKSDPQTHIITCVLRKRDAFISASRATFSGKVWIADDIPVFSYSTFHE